MVINASNLVVSEDASRQEASNSTEESGKSPVVLDPEKIFSSVLMRVHREFDTGPLDPEI